MEEEVKDIIPPETETVKANIDSTTNKIEEPTIVKTDIGAKDGQNKCPKCGSTEITTNIETGKLRCLYCRYEFEPEKISGMVEDISELKGEVIGSGATDIVSGNDTVTFKCTSCGAEVVVDTASAPQARCHWCRNTLSVNQQIPNGAIPDVLLPFSVPREVAKDKIEKFVGGRKFFAHPKFKQEFTTDNIMGVYFPYMLVDINAHANLVGEGEHQTRKYYVKSGDNTEARYDADLYHVERDFDIIVKGLSIESSSDKLNVNSNEKTNNIINSIMPFDVENCVKYNSNYLKGYTSEKRDTNIDMLKPIVDVQAKDIARFAANDTLKEYDRGVKWSSEDLKLKGEQWKAAYLPVWLYSYQETKKDKKILHYVAVNARTKETMGSVPIHMPKLLGVSFLVEVASIILMVLVDWDYRYLFLLSGIIYFIIVYSKYRNKSARHTYEIETQREIKNLNSVDDYIKSKKGLSNSIMEGANNKKVMGKNSSNAIFDIANKEALKSNVVDSIVDSSPLASIIKDNINKKGGN